MDGIIANVVRYFGGPSSFADGSDKPNRVVMTVILKKLRRQFVSGMRIGIVGVSDAPSRTDTAEARCRRLRIPAIATTQAHRKPLEIPCRRPGLPQSLRFSEATCTDSSLL